MLVAFQILEVKYYLPRWPEWHNNGKKRISIELNKGHGTSCIHKEKKVHIDIWTEAD